MDRSGGWFIISMPHRCLPVIVVLKVTCKPPVEGGGKMELLESDGHPLTILAAPGKDDAIFSGECEDTLDTPRNDRMGMEASRRRLGFKRVRLPGRGLCAAHVPRG